MENGLCCKERMRSKEETHKHKEKFKVTSCTSVLVNYYFFHLSGASCPCILEFKGIQSYFLYLGFPAYCYSLSSTGHSLLYFSEEQQVLEFT